MSSALSSSMIFGRTPAIYCSSKVTSFSFISGLRLCLALNSAARDSAVSPSYTTILSVPFFPILTSTYSFGSLSSILSWILLSYSSTRSFGSLAPSSSYLGGDLELDFLSAAPGEVELLAPFFGTVLTGDSVFFLTTGSPFG